MLTYEVLDQFRKALEADQASSTDPATGCIDTTPYDENRMVHHISFEVDIYGQVTIRCLVQFGVMEQLMSGNKWSMAWSTSCYEGSENLHLDMKLEEQPDVRYTTVLSKRDIKALYERMCIPYPEDKSITEAWEILYGKGMVTL